MRKYPTTRVMLYPKPSSTDIVIMLSPRVSSKIAAELQSLKNFRLVFELILSIYFLVNAVPEIAFVNKSVTTKNTASTSSYPICNAIVTITII